MDLKINNCSYRSIFTLGVATGMMTGALPYLRKGVIALSGTHPLTAVAMGALPSTAILLAHKLGTKFIIGTSDNVTHRKLRVCATYAIDLASGVGAIAAIAYGAKMSRSKVLAYNIVTAVALLVTFVAHRYVQKMEQLKADVEKLNGKSPASGITKEELTKELDLLKTQISEAKDLVKKAEGKAETELSNKAAELQNQINAVKGLEALKEKVASLESRPNLNAQLEQTKKELREAQEQNLKEFEKHRKDFELLKDKLAKGSEKIGASIALEETVEENDELNLDVSVVGQPSKVDSPKEGTKSPKAALESPKSPKEGAKKGDSPVVEGMDGSMVVIAEGPNGGVKVDAKPEPKLAEPPGFFAKLFGGSSKDKDHTKTETEKTVTETEKTVKATETVKAEVVETTVKV